MIKTHFSPLDDVAYSVDLLDSNEGVPFTSRKLIKNTTCSDLGHAHNNHSHSYSNHLLAGCANRVISSVNHQKIKTHQNKDTNTIKNVKNWLKLELTIASQFQCKIEITYAKSVTHLCYTHL